MIKYRSYFNTEIEKVIVERETEKFVWLDGSRRAKRSGYESYHDSWEEAKDFIIAVREREVAKSMSRLESAREKLSHAMALEKDDG